MTLAWRVLHTNFHSPIFRRKKISLKSSSVYLNIVNMWTWCWRTEVLQVHTGIFCSCFLCRNTKTLSFKMEHSSLQVNTDGRTGTELLKEAFCLLLWFWKPIWKGTFVEIFLLLPDYPTQWPKLTRGNFLDVAVTRTCHFSSQFCKILLS